MASTVPGNAQGKASRPSSRPRPAIRRLTTRWPTATATISAIAVAAVVMNNEFRIGLKVRASELYRAYGVWAGSAGERPLSLKQFGARLTDRGFERQKFGSARRWHRVGLGLRAEDELL